MRLPPLFATGLWLGATVASTAMVWTATSIVAADVTDRPAPVVAHQDVVSELESGSSVIGTIPTSTTLKANGPLPTPPASGRGPVASVPSASLPSAPRTPQPGGTTPPPSPTTTTTRAAGAAPSPRPTSPPTTQPPRPTATYSTTGGQVRVACNGFFIELLAAIPSNGYSVRVISAGPGNVDVRFVRSGQEHSVKAACFGQPFRYYEQNPPRQPPRSP